MCVRRGWVGAFWLIKSTSLSCCGIDGVPYYVVVGVCIDEQ